MKKISVLYLTLIFGIWVFFSGGICRAERIPDDKILIQSGVDPWVPNPLVGDHKWKEFFSDEKYSSSKKAEFTWYYDLKTVLKATTQTLDLKGQPLKLEGAMLAWVKVVELRNNRHRFLFYALWPEKRIALFFGIFEKEDGAKYFEEIGLSGDIPKMDPGLERKALEGLSEAVFKPWWKVW